MKKTILLILTAIAVFTSSQAQVVNEQQALQQANQFFQKMDAESRQPARHHGTLKRSMPRSVESTAENGDAPAYYIFNRGEDGGFVIVSGDMRTSHSILGYSSKGTLKTENAPANVLAWLNGYAAEIRAIQKHNTGIEGGTGWQEAVGNVVVAPLITTQWDQGEPFNDKCPMRKGERTAVGCSGVAAAQIMNYHRWPLQGQGSVEYEWSTSTIAKDFSQSTYNYDNLDVAQFLYDVAVGGKTDFDTPESGAYESDLARAMMKYFDYDRSMQIHYRNRKDYDGLTFVPNWDDEEWDNMLRSELDAHRPVLYGGGYKDTGHEFVCDGYDDAGYFHFNWGWSGYCDGWFLTTSLYPTDKEDRNSFNWNQTAIIGIKPNEGGTLQYGCAGTHGFIWGLADAVNVMYCMENEKTHEKYYGTPSTFPLTGDIYGISYGTIPSEFPQKGQIPAGTYRKYLVCNEPGTDVYQTITYAYATDKAKEAETFTWVDVAEGGLWTESSSRTFSHTIYHTTDNYTKYDYFIINDKEVRLTGVTFNWNVDYNKSPVLDSLVTYRGNEYVVTEINCNLWDLRPKYPGSIKKMTVQFGGVQPTFPSSLEELDLVYEDEKPVIFPSSLKVLKFDSYYGYKGTSLTLPPSLEVIVSINAPEITSLTIPASVRQLPGHAGGRLYVNKANTIIFEEGCKVKTIGAECFNKGNVKTLVLHEGLETIGDGAFNQCSELVSLSLPKSLKRIEGFGICKKLEEVTVAEGSQLEEINGFNFCSNLWHFDFPANLKYLEGFESSGFTEVDLSGTQLEDIAAFDKCNSLKSVLLPPTMKAITSLYTGVTKALVVPNGVETIGELNGPYIASLVLPSTLTYFGDSKLYNGAKVVCEAITPPDGRGLTCVSTGGRTYRNIYLYVPTGTQTAYKEHSYDYYGNIYRYYVPVIEMAATDAPINVLVESSGATVMGSPKVDSVLVIPASVSTSEGEQEVSRIADYAFSSNPSIISVDIPATVGASSAAAPFIGSRAESTQGIGKYAFAYCMNLNTMYVHWASPLTISADVFEGLDLSALTLVVPDNTSAYYATADVWKDFGTIVEESVQGIDTPTILSPSDKSNSIYDLMGRRVTNTRPGIYIKAGKKILVK